MALIRLAKRYGRYGYRKIAALLRMEGWAVNHKKVERLWREEGLQRPKRHKKRRRLYHKDSSVIRLRPQYQNHIWSLGCSEELTFIFYNVPSFLSGAHICLVIRTLRMNNGAV